MLSTFPLFLFLLSILWSYISQWLSSSPPHSSPSSLLISLNLHSSFLWAFCCNLSLYFASFLNCGEIIFTITSEISLWITSKYNGLKPVCELLLIGGCRENHPDEKAILVFSSKLRPNGNSEREEIAEATTESSPFILLRRKLTLRAVTWLVKSTEILNGRFDPGPSSPDSRPDFFFFLIHAESIWHLCSYHSRTVSYHHYLLEIPQVKGRVPSKAAFTSDASCKFWVSPGHLHLWSADYKFRGSYNPLRFDDSLEWPT